jgi:hypothetical protein
MDRVEDLFMDHSWFDMNFSLAAAFAQYVVCIRRFPWEARVPAESQTDVCRFAVLLLEVRDSSVYYYYYYYFFCSLFTVVQELLQFCCSL